MALDVITLTQNLIRCPSVTPEDAGALDVVAKALEPLGFTCTRLKFGNIDNLFARRGTGSPHFCFAGHTDVVPPGDESRWTHPPFGAVIADGKIYGRGASDMKGNIAAFIAAVSAMPRGKGSISLLITGDEEAEAVNGTIRVLEWMQSNGHVPDVALVGEPTNPDAIGDEIKIGRRGSLSGLIEVKGIQGHVAYPDRADNPIPKLARMVEVLSNWKPDSGSDHFGPSTLQVTNLHVGNTADNVIPGQARARFNIRFNDKWTHATLEKKIRTLLDETSAAYNVTFQNGAESFVTAPGPFTNLVRDAVHAVTGRVPSFSTSGGTSDARFIQKYCPVVECGVTNQTIHKFDECVAVEDLKTLQKIYQEILARYNG